jgi:hypothetical protein
MAMRAIATAMTGKAYIDRKVEQLVLERVFGGLRREGLAARWAGDDGEELELCDGGAGDVEALCIGTGIGRGEKESIVVDERVEKGPIGGRETFEDVSAAEGDADPEALGSWASKKGLAGQAFGVGGVGEVEVANIADQLDVVEGKGDDSSAKVEKVDGRLMDEASVGKVSGKAIAGVTSHEDFFAGTGHWSAVLGDCRTAWRTCHEKQKIVWPSSASRARMEPCAALFGAV